MRHGEELEKRFDDWAPAICRQQIEEHDDDYEDQAACQDSQGRLRSGGAGVPRGHKDGAPHKH
jgi:hypothetical protein